MKGEVWKELETQLGEKQHAAVWTGRHREGLLDERANVWTITKSNRDGTGWTQHPKSRRQCL